VKLMLQILTQNPHQLLLDRSEQCPAPSHRARKMIKATIHTATTTTDAAALDDLLWHVLWQPLNLPRDVRHAFSIDGEELELVAKESGQLVGGLVAVWRSGSEVELRHLAVATERQHRGIGRSLVAEFVRIVASRGGGRIHTIARNTSAEFFRRLGFRTAPGEVPEHPVFVKHGISFELMERAVEPAGASAWR